MDILSPPAFAEHHVRDLDIQFIGTQRPLQLTLLDTDALTITDTTISVRYTGGAEFVADRRHVLWYEQRGQMRKIPTKPRPPVGGTAAKAGSGVGYDQYTVEPV